MLDVADHRTTTVSAAAAHAAAVSASSDFIAERLFAPRTSRHTCSGFANDPTGCAACDAQESAVGAEIENVIAGDESLSELIACAVSCTDAKPYTKADGTTAVIPEDKTGATLLALFRAGNWHEFGEILTNDVARRARNEAEIRLERAA